jgi:hypothetical protein
MPGTRPRKVTTEKGLKLQPPPAKLPKTDFLHVLRTAGVPEETIKATDEQLQDPIDLEREGWGLAGHANTNAELVSAARAQIAELGKNPPAHSRHPAPPAVTAIGLTQFGGPEVVKAATGIQASCCAPCLGSVRLSMTRTQVVSSSPS